MKVPTVSETETFLKEAEKLNPGLWVAHSRTVGFCARIIAEKCDNLSADTAYVLGLLHDIGRRQGITDMKHTVDGYRFMISKGYDDSAKVCLTHSFPYKNINSYNGKNDLTVKETEFIKDFITNAKYDDYDRLIQLCDAISLPDGPTYIEKRLVDVVMRRGFNDYTIPKWKAFFELKNYFDSKIDKDIYKIIGVK